MNNITVIILSYNEEVNIEYALKNNFGFGGTNGSLVFKKV